MDYYQQLMQAPLKLKKLMPTTEEMDEGDLNGKFVYGFTSEFTDFMGKPALNFSLGPQTKDGYLSDQHADTTQIEKLFEDIPGIDYNTSENTHTLSGTTFSDVAHVAFDPKKLIAIVIHRLDSLGADDRFNDLPMELFDEIKEIQKELSGPAVSAPSFLSLPTTPVDIKDWIGQVVKTTSDIKSLLSKIFPTMPAKGWKRISKKTSGTQCVRVFNHTQGLQVLVVTDQDKLAQILSNATSPLDSCTADIVEF